MNLTKKSLCVFIHFGNMEYIPKYVEIYVNELSLYFDEVIFVMNRRRLDTNLLFLNKNITLKQVKNEGYDFGMFYKTFQQIVPSQYDQIACINDSNVLFHKLTPIFEWDKSANLDFWGLIDSNERPIFSTHQDNYHIQSHFLVFNEKAIQLLPTFFNSVNLASLFNETDVNKVRHKVIDQWEIGISQFMLKNGLNIGSFIDSQTFSQLYSSEKINNVSHQLYAELIYSGYPLLKKKVIKKSNWKDIFRSQKLWKKLIQKYGNQEWEIEALTQELIEMSNKS